MTRQATIFAALLALAASARGDDDYAITNRFAASYALDTRATTYAMVGRGSFDAVPPLTFGTNGTGTVTVTDPGATTSMTFNAATWNAALALYGDRWPILGVMRSGAWSFSLGGGGLPSGGAATFNVSMAGSAAYPGVFESDTDVPGGCDGCVFTLGDGASLASLDTAGYGVTALGGGLYRLDEGAEYDYQSLAASGSGFALDTRQDSTARVVRSASELVPIAYTADDWAYESADAVTLTFTSPRGVETVVDGLTGSGGYDFSWIGAGLWHVAMNAGGASEEATILLALPGLFIDCR